jgi:hypothetical protein
VLTRDQDSLRLAEPCALTDYVVGAGLIFRQIPASAGTPALEFPHLRMRCDQAHFQVVMAAAPGQLGPAAASDDHPPAR